MNRIRISFLVSSLLFFLLSKTFAQSDSLVPNRYWSIQVYPGVNIDLSGGKKSNNGLFPGRADLTIAGGFKFQHLFSQQHGWYAAMDMTMFREQTPDYFNREDVFIPAKQILKDFAKGLVSSIAPRPGIQVGWMYRFRGERWELLPSVGLGANVHFWDDEGNYDMNEDNTYYQLKYKLRSGGPAMHLSFSANYFLWKKGYLVLNADFGQPLRASTAEVAFSQNGVEVKRFQERSFAVGRRLNLSVGYGFVFGRH